jgi:hypothetical protein
MVRQMSRWAKALALLLPFALSDVAPAHPEDWPDIVGPVSEAEFT